MSFPRRFVWTLHLAWLLWRWEMDADPAMWHHAVRSAREVDELLHG